MNPVSTVTGPASASTVTVFTWPPTTRLTLEEPNLVVPAHGVRRGQAAHAGSDDSELSRSVRRSLGCPRVELVLDPAGGVLGDL